MIDAMKQAIEALEPFSTYGRPGSRDVETYRAITAITALRAAIAAAERAECVGEIRVKNGYWIDTPFSNTKHLADGLHKLYAHPPAITDQMVEWSAQTLANLNHPYNDWPSGFDAAFQAHFRKHARAALEAALGVKHAK